MHIIPSKLPSRVKAWITLPEPSYFLTVALRGVQAVILDNRSSYFGEEILPLLEFAADIGVPALLRASVAA